MSRTELTGRSTSVPGSPSHLTRRFFDVLLAKPLTTGEVAGVKDLLRGAEIDLFFSQPIPDQRHGHQAAMTVVAAGESDLSVIRAALLHDVGKRYSRLGVMGRTLASLLIRFRLPLTRRMLLYRDHGVIASRELAELRCEPLVADFALHHHGPRPETIPSSTWELLQQADQPPKTGTLLRARIS